MKRSIARIPGTRARLAAAVAAGAAAIAGTGACLTAGTVRAVQAVQAASRLTDHLSSIGGQPPPPPDGGARAWRHDLLDAVANLGDYGLLIRPPSAYGETRPLYLRALGVWTAALDPKGPGVPTRFDGASALAGTRLDDASGHGAVDVQYLPELERLESTLPATDPRIANELEALAWVYRARGAYRDAEQRLTRALDIREHALGPAHPDVAVGLINLAELHQVRGAYAEAERLLVRARDILAAAHPAAPGQLAIALNALAALYRDQGAYARAEALLVQALDLLDPRHASSDPDVATCLDSLAEVHAAQGQLDRAEPLLARAAAIHDAALDALPTLLEARGRGLMRLVEGETHAIVSLAAGPDRSPRLALTTVLRRKARIADAAIEVQMALREHRTPEIQRLIDELGQATSESIASMDRRELDAEEARMRADIAQLAPDRQSSTLRMPSDEDFRALDADVQASQSRKLELGARIVSLHSQLIAEAARIRASTPGLASEVASGVTIERVQAALPRGAALVEFHRYHRFDPRQARQPWREARYVAYVLTAHGPPQAVALGEAGPIDAAVDAALSALYGAATPEAARGALRQLDALVYAPVRPRLAGASQVLIAPDGELDRVPFEALVDAQGHRAVEQQLISYVSSGRDLLRLARLPAPRSPAVLVADPAYGAPRPAPALVLQPLDGARAEAVELARYFAAAPLTGVGATKAALRALSGPALLHIATHALYMRGGSALQLLMDPRAVAISDRGLAVKSAPAAAEAPKLYEAPSVALGRAGIALAGANEGASGILTATELASFDWAGTQLVVLSACETAVGAVASGEGTYGLQRALALAGTASQVVSLWSVNDAATEILMGAFYRELAHGAGRAEALRRAKRHLMQQPGYGHPHYWAPFILAGDWRPLDRNVLRAP